MELTEMRKKLKKALTKERYEHTKGVMYTAAALAMAYEYDIQRAMIAGLLHDCCKCMSPEENISICDEHHVLLTQVEYDNPALIHAKAGSVYAQTNYGINDPEILHAIRVHTTGEPDMTLLDKILFVSDYIEPGRDKAANLTEIRRLAFSDINQCVAKILYDTLHFLNQKKGVIDPQTSITYEYYQQFMEVK